MELLQVENLTFTYPDAKKPALTDVTYTVREGTFTVLCGASGCGKSTLLHLLKKELAPFGKKSGSIRFDGTDYESLDSRVSASQIGILMQDPDSQIVTDVVWQELAFALENLGTERSVIRTRVAEMATYFGIESWYHKRTSELSGGQKQLLNLASVMTLSPRLLLLDEPTAQLDPIAAGNFLSMLERVHRELGVTVLIAEHRLEDILPMADRVLVLTDGALTLDGTVDSLADAVREGHPLLAGMPAAARLWKLLGTPGDMPLSVTEGRAMLRAVCAANVTRNTRRDDTEVTESAASLSEVYFRYERNGKDVLRDCSVDIQKGEHFCLLGGNGSGKTTLLHIIAGILRPYAGSCRLFGKKLAAYRSGELANGITALLPQNPKDVFVTECVKEDWLLACKTTVPEAEREETVRKTAEMLGAMHLADCHPYDLSGGEQQKAALVKVLLRKPKLLLLDEPTKGLDARYKEELLAVLKKLKDESVTVLTVTHDLDFAAVSADRVGLCFDGGVTAVKPTHEFFTENSFYTTAACRIAGKMFPGAITCEEIAEAVKGEQA
ncbi:MAG: ATP-binding cassette domain-containing protein [Lachnospiraceae bacterium]|nr:ATP-binding cassette domain-containing protein [Lachnospiraceae bacterium]